MNLKELIGDRVESLFKVLITEWCPNNGDRPWFSATFLGEKHPHTDFLVKLLGVEPIQAIFWVQVKSTQGRYRGVGDSRQLDVNVTGSTVEGLRGYGTPAYVIGIDIDARKGYVRSVNSATSTGFRGISTRFELDCDSLKQLWDEVLSFYRMPGGRGFSSHFG